MSLSIIVISSYNLFYKAFTEPIITAANEFVGLVKMPNFELGELTIAKE